VDEVCSLIELSKDVILSKNPCSNLDVWVTALTLCYLEKKFGSTKDLWQMVAKKGVIFVKKGCKTLNFEYDRLMSEANLLVV